jgi:hypothetical protein
MRTKALQCVALGVTITAFLLTSTGCPSRQESGSRPALSHDDKAVMEVDSANPSNVLVTITFRNPVPTAEKGVVINYYSVHLQRDSAGVKTNSFLPISPGPTQGVSVCAFSIPENEVKTCRVHLSGVTSKPVGEAVVAREVKLGDPSQISRRTVDPQRVNASQSQ